MNIIQIIDKKRRGESHTFDELAFLIQGMLAGTVADYQVSAWLMAACIQGLSLEETTWLTDLFVQSGSTLDLSGVDGTVVDKHSTGGVGDKTTLVLAPLLAASGVKVAKLSGRGLGFTGGTIDKLEAIPGFRVSLSTEEMVEQVRTLGVAISGQTQDLAPADGRIYALRDVTATVDNIPLIAASVVSKKIAAGAQVIVLDIKYGRGAFMKTLAEAKELAETCREVGKRLGKTISTVLSAMDQPLGAAIGHSVEVMETVNTLKGQGPADLEDLSLTLGSVALVGAGRFATMVEARAHLKQCLTSGDALSVFREMVVAQGGDPAFIDEPERLPQPQQIVTLVSQTSGYLGAVDSLRVAESAKILGAGRTTKADVLDLGVGVVLKKKIGDSVLPGDILAELWVGERAQEEAMEVLRSAFAFSQTPVTPPPLVEEIYCVEPVSSPRR